MRWNPPRSPFRPSLTPVALCLGLALFGCVEDRGRGGHATIRFAGSVRGVLNANLDVVCSRPSEEGERFKVSLDSDKGAAVGGRTFKALEFETPAYQGPRTYDLTGALVSDEEYGDDWILLFAEHEDQPLTWSEEGATGSLTIDPGESSGRMSIHGWRAADQLRVDLDGSFRCGEREQA